MIRKNVKKAIDELKELQINELSEREFFHKVIEVISGLSSISEEEYEALLETLKEIGCTDYKTWKTAKEEKGEIEEDMPIGKGIELADIGTAASFIDQFFYDYESARFGLAKINDGWTEEWLKNSAEILESEKLTRPQTEEKRENENNPEMSEQYKILERFEVTQTFIPGEFAEKLSGRTLKTDRYGDKPIFQVTFDEYGVLFLKEWSPFSDEKMTLPVAGDMDLQELIPLGIEALAAHLKAGNFNSPLSSSKKLRGKELEEYLKESIQMLEDTGRRLGIETEVEMEEKNIEEKNSKPLSRDGAVKLHENYRREEKLAKQSIPGWVERGEKLIYPERLKEWKELVETIAPKLEYGSVLEAALEIMEVLANGATLDEAKEIFDKKGLGISAGLARGIVLNFSKRGPEFWEHTSYGEISPEDRKALDEMIRENKELEEKHSKDADKGTEETHNVEEDLSNLSVEELEKISQGLDDEIAQKQTEIDDKKKQILIQSITSKRGRLKELAREDQQLTEQIEQQPTKGPQK